ncbi:alpha/beta hydrolase-fold protein [Streptomyces sp. NPDC046465]|uniref:alpha/beta hydrolase n=1 Tax=Streptomyces sp. NPDC046465 TaxID=3155810 RepID=UPI0033EF82C1
MRTWPAPTALAAALVLTGTPAPAATAAAVSCPAIAAGDANGLDMRYWRPSPDGLVCEAEFTTGALFTPRGPGAPQIDPVRRPVRVRVQLPAPYDPSAAYPVLYLLNGGAADYEQWTSGGGNVTDSVTKAGFKGIVVMPEGGKVGFYSDWQGSTYGNFTPLWETFHIKQLVPWIDAHFATSGRRAVAGMSMGGYGALKYAAQHPDLFSAVGAFSGGTDIRRPDHQQIVNEGTTAYGARFWWHGSGSDAGNYWKYLLPGNPNALQRTELVFGPQSGWPAFNPAQVARSRPDAYRSYQGKMALYAGRSEDPYAWNDELHATLKQQTVPHRYCSGPGGHDFSTWTPALKHFLGFAFGPAPAPCPDGTGWRQEP